MTPKSENIRRLKATIERVAPSLEDEAATRVLTDSELDIVREGFAANERAKELAQSHSKIDLIKILDACSKKATKLAT